MTCGLVIEENCFEPVPVSKTHREDGSMKYTYSWSQETVKIHDKGLATMVGYDGEMFDAKDNKLLPHQCMQFHRLRTLQKYSNASTTPMRSLILVLRELHRLVSVLELPDSVHDSAAVVCRNAKDKSLFRGHTLESVASAAVYIACRQCSIPRTMDEIAAVSHTDTSHIRKTYRYLAKGLELRLPPPNPVDYIPRFCMVMELPFEVEQSAKTILEQTAELQDLAGRSPIVLAVSAIYVAAKRAGCTVTQRKAAETAGISMLILRTVSSIIDKSSCVGFTAVSESSQ